MKQFDSSLLHDKLKEYFGFSSFKGSAMCWKARILSC